jgi:hypothetical protein
VRLFGFVHEAEKVTPELLQVKPNTKILYAQDTIRVYERRPEGGSTSPFAVFFANTL